MGDLTQGTLAALLAKLPPSRNEDDSATFGVDRSDTLLTVSVDDLNGELLEIIPHKENEGIEDGVNLLQSLHDVRIEEGENVSKPHSFEVWYDRGEFHFFLEAATERARDRFQRRVSNVYPDAEVNPVDSGVGFPVIEPEMHRAGGWLKEKRHTFLPIKHHNAEGFETGDPYADILGEMATLDNSLVVLQIIFKPAHPKWTHKGPDGAEVEDIAHNLRSADVEDLTKLRAWNPLREIEEIPATKKDKEAAKIVEEQRGRQGFHANIRVLAASPDRYEAEERARGTTSMFAKYYNSQTEQGLRAHGVDAENVDRFYGSCITREWVDRSMILSIDELAGVAHIPNGEIEVPGIQWRHSKTGSDAPSTAPKDEISESRDYSYSSQSGVSGNDDGSLSVSDDSRPGQSNPDDGSILSESASTHNLERSKTEPETESEAGSTSERTDGGSTSTTTDGSAWDDGPTVDGGITDSHPPAGHEQTAGDNLVASRDGNGYVDAVNEQRAEAIARQFTTDIEASNTAFESIDDVDEEAVREAAHDYTDEDLGEFGSPQSQQAEYAVWDKFEDENPEWASGKRSPAYDAITYVSTPDDGTEEPPTPSDSAVDGATDGQVTVATSTLDESANNELEGEAESSTDIPADVVLPEEFTMECPSSQSPQSYERLTMDGDDYWMCSGCGRTVKRNGVPEHAYETPESDDNSDSQKQTRDRPIGMDRVQLTPAEELFSEYVELLIASVPPDKQHWITADTTVRELIEIIRELEQQDDLVPLSAGVLENTRPDTLSEDEVLDEGRIKLPSQMGLGDDEMVDRPLDALDIAPDEIDSWGVPPADRSPEGSASSPTGSTADTDGIDDRAVDTDDTSATDAAADVDADTEAADVDADTATLLDGEQPADEQPAETHPRPEESNTDATDEPQSETTVNTEQDSDSDSDPDTDTAPDGRGAWWGQDDPDQTTVEANIDDAPEQADSSPFDDEWVDGSTDDSDDDTQHSAETNAEATDPTTTTTNERH